MPEKDETRADIEIDLKRAFEDEEKAKEELAERIAAAESDLAAGKEIDTGELAQDYLASALDAQEEDDFEKTAEWLEKAIQLLSGLSELTNPNVLLLAQIHLTYGITLNDQGMWSDALAEYDIAEELLEKLSSEGNIEAILDLAGIRLNIATIRFELGEYDASMAEFEKVKSDFASLIGTEKEPEAYYYLAKTYLQEAAVCREMGDDAKGVQRLEEGIALYRKMVENGDTESSVDLAEALAEYAQILECSGEKEPGEIIPYIDEAVERFRGGIAAGRADVCPDLLNASVSKGRLMNYMNRSEEAESFLTETVEIFEGIRETEDLSALLSLITLHDERGKSRYALDKIEDALADYDEAVSIVNRLPKDFFEEEDHSHCDDGCCCSHHQILRSEGNLALFSVYVNRAKILHLLKRDDEAKADAAKVEEVLMKVKEYLGEDYQGYKDVCDALIKSL